MFTLYSVSVCTGEKLKYLQPTHAMCLWPRSVQQLHECVCYCTVHLPVYLAMYMCYIPIMYAVCVHYLLHTHTQGELFEISDVYTLKYLNLSLIFYSCGRVYEQNDKQKQNQQ